MPTYDYVCEQCKYKLEVVQKITEPALTDCPQCFAPSFKRKPGGGIGLSFKGTGFYKTDYGTSGEPQKDKTSKEDKPAGSCHKGGCGCH